MPEQGDILLYTLSQSIAIRKFGQVNSQVLDRIRSVVRDLLASRS